MSELARINRYSTAGELSSSIAHEINQPLATILANAETATLMLQQAPPNLDEIRHILLDIQRDNHRASDIVRHLRNLFKGGGFEAKVIDLNEVINEVIEIASATAERHRVQVQSVFETPCIQVEGDAVQLQQVVMNLLMNAIDAVTQEHGPRTVVVRVGQVAGRARLSVIDTGSGVPPEKKEEIFEPLFTTKDGGMGMGLAIVRTIVRAHGGQIRVDDAVGGGAVFLVTLPLAPITHA
jgi:signal transduction histidine kinase